MNAQEIIELVRVLKQSGAIHFKSHDFELSLNPDAKEVKMDAPLPPQVENVEATAKLKDLIGTLRGSDEDLLNKIFPAGA